jgi:hypothetical protein
MSNKIEYVPEKTIGQTNPIPLMLLLEIGQKKICKINCTGGGTGTGFFCNLIIDGWNSLRVLFTNNHVLNKDDIKPGKQISFSINNGKQNYKIEIDKERKVYTSKIYDVTIIEMRMEDKINLDSFFEVDNNIYDPSYNFKDKPIIILHYPKGDELSLSQGTIKNIGDDENYFEIYHLCSTDHGSSGCPLINIKDYKVLGIHKGASLKFNFNCGTLLKDPIIEFKDKIKNTDNKIKDKIINIEEKKEEKIEKEKEENNLKELKEKKKI